MVRIAATLLLVLVVAGGNALAVRPGTVAWLVTIKDASGSKQPASMQWLETQHLLLAAKDPLPRPLHTTRGEAQWHVVALPRAALRPFRLAVDWPMLAHRLASTSLCWLEIRRQV
jgi:hypothetical protein